MRRSGLNVLDDSRPVWRTMLVFLIPLMLSNALQSASSTLNSIYLGQLIGTQALAAASAFFPILFFLISFFVGIASGATVLIGQAFGAKDMERVRSVAGTAISVALALGVIIGVFGGFATEQLLRLTGTPSDIFAAAAGYAKIILFTLPVLFLYLVYTTILRGVGDSRTPFYFLIVSTVLGVVLTPAFIQGWFGLPHLGVASAAVASAGSTALGLVGLLIVLARRGDVLALDAKMLAHLRIQPQVLAALLRIGLPTGVQFVMVSLSEIAVITFVNRYGSGATAAYGAVNQIVSYVQFPAISIGIATSVFGAQSIGARRFDRLRAIVHSAVGLNYAIGIALVIVVYTFSWPILGAFVRDPHTLAIAHDLMTITLWSYVFFGNNAVLSGMMRSSGTVFWPTLISISAIWLVEVPIAYTLSQHTHFGLQGVWIAYPITFLVGLSLQFSYYRFVWRRKQLAPIPV
jgi:putative MATE family efflux protein